MTSADVKKKKKKSRHDTKMITIARAKVGQKKMAGLLRDLNPGPLAP